MKINLLFGYSNITGGALSLALHLSRCLEEFGGHHCYIYHVGNSTRYIDGIPLVGIPEDVLPSSATKGSSLIVHLYDNTSDDRYSEMNSALIASGVPLFIHDLRGISKRTIRTRCVTARQSVADALYNAGTSPYLVRFPYKSYFNGESMPYEQRPFHSVFASRIAPEKNVEIILEANQLLEQQGCEPVKMYGKMEMRYVNLVLTKKYPHWRRYYLGPHPDTAEYYSALQCFKYAVDLSVLESTSSSVQYSFLEAMDAGCRLIIHDRWIQGLGDMDDGYNCVTVSSPEQLADVLSNGYGAQVDGRATLAKFAPSQEMSEHWMEVITNA